MSRIPTHTPQVDHQNLPGVQLGAQATPDAFGAGLAQGAASAAHDATAIAFEEKQKADQVAVLGGLAQHGQKLNEIEANLTQTRGSQAIQRGEDGKLVLQQSTMDDYDKATDEIAQGLNDDTQRQEFKAEAARRRVALDGTVRNHILRESDAYEKESLDGFLKSSQEAAISNADDPARVTMEAVSQFQRLQEYAQRRGLPEEAWKSQAQQQVSGTYTGAIQSLLAQGNTSLAKASFDRAKATGTIVGSDAIHLEGALRAANDRDTSRAITDQITATAPDLQSALTGLEAKNIKDTEVYDRAKERLVNHYDLADRAQKQHEQKLFDSASDAIDKASGDWQSVDPSVWQGLPEHYKTALRSYAAKVAKGEPVVTDFDTYYGIERMAGGDATMPQFLQTDLRQFKDRISKPDLDKLTDLQRELGTKSQDKEAAARLTWGITTREQVVDGYLKDMGVDTTPSASKDNVTLANSFRAQLDRAVIAQQQETKKPVTEEDVRKIAGRLVSNVPVPTTGWFGRAKTVDTRAFQVPGADRQAYSLEQIPPADLQQIQQSASEQGKALTAAQMLDIYNQHTLRSAAQAP